MQYTHWEAAIGGLLQDIGKFMQRAHASSAQLPASTRAIENTICPTNAAGRTTHKHVLWTNAFFDLMEERGLAMPT